MMNRSNGLVRKYGNKPYKIAVIHGGPGGGGEVAPVARRLSEFWGVLEPIQTATSLVGQIEELRTSLEKYGELPVTLVGYSWGAWLAYLTAVKYPELVRKLILVGSAPFEAKYVPQIGITRRERLGPDGGAKFSVLLKSLQDPNLAEKDSVMSSLGELVLQADTYDLCNADFREEDMIDEKGDIFQKVWPEAASLRKSGELLKMANDIKCPVTAIHGDYDPHPVEGVEEPLADFLADFKFILLNKCGHSPWREKQAKEAFYAVLIEEILSEVAQ